MRAFLEKFGEGLFVVILLTIMILFATPLGRNVLGHVVDFFRETTGVTKNVGCDHELTTITPITVEATCTKNGKVTYTCSKCGETVEHKTAKAEHNLVPYKPTDTTYNKASTCSSKGFATYECSVCKEKRQIELMEKEHNFKFVRRISTATKTSIGEDEYKCSVCNTTNILEIPMKESGDDGLEYTYKLMNGTAFQTFLHDNYSSFGHIKEVYFTDIEAPDGATVYDVTEQQDGSVVLWVDGISRQMYISTQKTGQKIKAHTNCEALLYSNPDEIFDKTTKVNVTNLDVSKVKYMKNMFRDVGIESSSIQFIGLETWDVSNVTNMSYMFYNVAQVATSFNLGDLTQWKTKTGKVTKMDYMFYKVGTRVSYTLNLSDWNVSKVTGYKEFNTGAEGKIIPPKWGY